MSKETNKFILLTTHRSGTRLLLRSIGSAAEIRCFKQAFDQTVLFDRFVFDRIQSGFYQFRSVSLKRRLDYLLHPEKVLDAFLTGLYTPQNDEKAIGLRLIYEQADKHPQILAWAVENEVGVIHLVRRNALETLAHTEASLKRGLVRTTSRARPAKTIRLSPDRLKAQLARLTGHTEAYRQQLKNGRYLEVCYEQLLSDLEHETHRVLNFLQIGQAKPVKIDPVTAGSGSLETLIENYEQVKQALKNTRFEQFLNQESCIQE